MRQFIQGKIVLPAFETLYKRRRTFGYLKELNRTQWLSRDELEHRQLESLRKLLLHAFTNCPYYRDAWKEARCDPCDLKSLDDFRRWPVIDRETIRANRMQMRAQIPGMKLISKSTGGSSGEPLQFDLNHDSNDRRCAASYRGYAWAGAPPGAKYLYLWGVPLCSRPASRRLKDGLFDAFHRRRVLNCFELSEQRAEEFLARHNATRADVLVGYTNALYEFARILRNRGLKPYRPTSIIAAAEKLHRFQRDVIEEVFGAPVFETYGSREFMLIAAECARHEGLHMTQEHLLIEVLDDRGQPVPAGGEGNIAITDLYNYGMPFIRYMNGDRGVSGYTACSCGRGLPLMRPVLGRVLDVLTTPDGRRLPGEFFPHLVKDFPAVKRFQVVQEEPSRVQMRVVAPGWADADRRRLEGLVVGALGPAVSFDLLAVPEIPLTGSGKLRVVINKCMANRN